MSDPDEPYDAFDDVNEKLDKLDDVVSKLDDVEAAIRQLKKNWYDEPPWNWLGYLFFFLIFFVWIPDAWHSNTRYAIQYQVSYDQITHYYRPTDCSFLRSPIGDKRCHYERRVTVITDNNNQKHVVIDWDKVDDDQPKLVQ